MSMDRDVLAELELPLADGEILEEGARMAAKGAVG